MFYYNQWDDFCNKLKKTGVANFTASSVLYKKPDKPFFILKHDVETKPTKALKLALIEQKYGLVGSFYVQAYILDNKNNIEILKRIQKLGHEVSYHHDVMDSNSGNITTASDKFKQDIRRFEDNSFKINTVCQHGNPIIERKGYTSNRDFFRDSNISKYYNQIADIMVNFKSKADVNYKYISDSGYRWKVIFDPENNDRINGEDRDIHISSLDEIINIVKNKTNVIISTHPHRWQSNILILLIRNGAFKFIKSTVKLFKKSSLINKLISKYYYLAKNL